VGGGMVLKDENGVDLSKVPWVPSSDEPVAESRPPANVVPIDKGKTIADMLASGELAAAIGVEANPPDVKPLIPDALEAGLSALRRSGPYPIKHTLGIKDQPIAQQPYLADQGFRALTPRQPPRVRALQAAQTRNPGQGG